jgi:hypothetical protein
MTAASNRLTLLATLAVLALPVLSLAGAAKAQAPARPFSPLPVYRAAPATPTAGRSDAEIARAAVDLTAPRTPLALSYAQTVALREAGEARTSVDRRFAKDGVTGSLGFLCGLQPRLDEHSGAAYGIDPHGRFLGAKLSRAF